MNGGMSQHPPFTIFFPLHIQPPPQVYPSSHMVIPSLHGHSGQPHHPQQGRLAEASEPQAVPGAHGAAAQAAGGAPGGAAALRQRRVALARLPRHRDAGDGTAPQLHVGEEKAEGQRLPLQKFWIMKE